MKVLFLLEHIRLDHYDNQGKWKYLQTPNGKTMKQVIENFTSLTRKDYTFAYVYNQVPQPIYNNYGKVIKYEDVKLKDARPYMEQCKEYIKELKPDIVIPTGKLGIKMLLNQSKLGSVRGVPQFIDELGTWVVPTYSVEYTNVNKNAERQVVADMELLERFVQNGEDAFKPKEVEYELVTSIERVREIFNKEVKNDNNDGVDITAWDLETNSLKPDRKGSKPLVLSMSWKNGQGVTIPLYKSDFNWENGQQDIDEVLSLLKDWVASKEDIKVGHNLKYDVKFLMTTQGFEIFENNQDTLVGWYLAVTQETTDSKRLSDLTYEVTDMGGYDKPLEDFKVWFTESLLKYFTRVIKDIEKENKKVAKTEFDIKATDYLEWLDTKIDINKVIELDKFEKQAEMDIIDKQYIDLGLQPEKVTKTLLFNDKEFKEVCQKSNEYMSLSDKGKEYTLGIAIDLINTFKHVDKVVNIIDGGKFNYDWIPLELMHPYASGDTDACRRIYVDVVDKLNKQDRHKALELLTKDYPRLNRTLARIESNGLYSDLDYMEKNDKAYKQELDKIEQKVKKHWSIQEFEEARYNLYELGVEEFSKPKKERDTEIEAYRNKFKDGGWKFNIGSGDHKGEVLYKILGFTLPYDQNYIKGASFNKKKEENIIWEDYKTDTKSLNYILSENDMDNETKELLEDLLYYASIRTKRNSFTHKLPQMVNKQTKTLHGSFSATTTSTSRLASSNP